MVKVKGIDKVLRQIAERKKEIFLEQKEEVLNDLVNTLKGVTPVDTGEARDGWHREGTAIVNDVPHIEQLNQGSSQQAPTYFIERTLLNQPGIKSSGMIVKSK